MWFKNQGLSDKGRIIFLIALLILFAFSTIFLASNLMLEWDEGSFLTNAQHFQEPGYNFESGRPALISIIVSILWSFTGESVLAARAVSVFFGALTLIIFYKVCQHFFEKPLLPTFFLGLSPIFLLWSSRIMTDIPALTMFLSAYLAFLKKKHLLAGVLISITATFRYVFGVLAVAFFLAYVFDKNKGVTDTSSFVLGGFLGALPFFIYSTMYYNSFLGKMILYTTQVSEWTGSGFLSSFNYNLEMMLKLLFPLLILGAYGIRESRLLDKFVLTVYTGFILGFSGVSFYRYWLPIIPLLIIIGYKKAPRQVFVALLSVFIITSGSLLVEQYSNAHRCQAEFEEAIGFVSEFDGTVVSSERWSISSFMLDNEVLSGWTTYEELESYGADYIVTSERLEYELLKEVGCGRCRYFVYRTG